MKACAAAACEAAAKSEGESNGRGGESISGEDSQRYRASQEQLDRECGSIALSTVDPPCLFPATRAHRILLPMADAHRPTAIAMVCSPPSALMLGLTSTRSMLPSKPVSAAISQMKYASR